MRWQHAHGAAGRAADLGEPVRDVLLPRGRRPERAVAVDDQFLEARGLRARVEARQALELVFLPGAEAKEPGALRIQPREAVARCGPGPFDQGTRGCLPHAQRLPPVADEHGSRLVRRQPERRRGVARMMVEGHERHAGRHPDVVGCRVGHHARRTGAAGRPQGDFERVGRQCAGSGRAPDARDALLLAEGAKSPVHADGNGGVLSRAAEADHDPGRLPCQPRGPALAPPTSVVAPNGVPKSWTIGLLPEQSSDQRTLGSTLEFTGNSLSLEGLFTRNGRPDA